MKVVGIAIVRTGRELNEPIPLTVTNDLSQFGFFQRQVRITTKGLKMTATARRLSRRRWHFSRSLTRIVPSCTTWGNAFIPFGLFFYSYLYLICVSFFLPILCFSPLLFWFFSELSFPTLTLETRQHKQQCNYNDYIIFYYHTCTTCSP